MAHPSGATRMTDGVIWKRIVVFAIPIFLGNLFQQFYNMADSLIVGNFLGSDALAAVSSSGPLIFLLVGFFNGLALGTGVVIARHYGAGDRERLHLAVHTTAALGVLAGIILTVAGVFLTPHLLVWMGTPQEILTESILYFRIYFLGSMGFVLYNFLVGILQSVGDSRHPLYYLIFSSALNILLDLLLVGGFGYGVGAAALATCISQFASALCCLVRLCRTREEYRLELRKVRIHRKMLRSMLSNGLPSGMQNAMISIANVVVQSSINGFGKLAMAGCGAYSKIEGFVFLPIMSFSLALSTFISQNLGAGEAVSDQGKAQEGGKALPDGYGRARQGAYFGVVCTVAISELLGALYYVSAPVLIGMFSKDPAVVAFGVRQARVESFFYMFLGFSHCMAGILRGAGRAGQPMAIMLVCWCLIRVPYIVLGLKAVPEIGLIFSAYPVTWMLSSAVFLYLLLKGDWARGFKKDGV